MTSGGRLRGLSAVVPAYNEAGNIDGVVEALLAVLPVVAGRHEIIVVDDGSSDGTGAAVAGRPGVRVIRHPTNRGYGAALRSGLAVAREPWCVFLDGDGQLDPRDLPRLVAAVDDADLVAGYRAARADPPLRRLYGWLWNALVRLLLGVRVRDVNCAFKLVHGEVLRSVTLESRGALLSAELLGKALRHGFRVRQVPVSHRGRHLGTATGGAPHVVARALYELAVLGCQIRVPATRPVLRPALRGGLARVLLVPALAPVGVGGDQFGSRVEVGTLVPGPEAGWAGRPDRSDGACSAPGAHGRYSGFFDRWR